MVSGSAPLAIRISELLPNCTYKSRMPLLIVFFQVTQLGFSVSDPDPHHFGKPDPGTHQIQNTGAVEACNGAIGGSLDQ